MTGILKKKVWYDNSSYQWWENTATQCPSCGHDQYRRGQETRCFECEKQSTRKSMGAKLHLQQHDKRKPSLPVVHPIYVVRRPQGQVDFVCVDPFLDEKNNILVFPSEKTAIEMVTREGRCVDDLFFVEADFLDCAEVPLATVKRKVCAFGIPPGDPPTYVDLCHCNMCDTNVAVELGEDNCPVCGMSGYLSNIASDFPFNATNFSFLHNTKTST